MRQDDKNGMATLRLAVVGGGRRCLTIMRLMDSRRLRRLQARIVGVADKNPEAVGFMEARRRGIFTTTNHLDLLDLPDLDLIIELTGDESLLKDLTHLKPESVGLVDYTASLLFHDIASFGAELEKKEDEISIERSFAHALTLATSEGVMVIDRNYRILRMNRAACRWADIYPENARGRFCFQVMHNAMSPCQSTEMPCPMRQTIDTGRSAHAIHEFGDAEGKPHYCDISTYPLVNGRGETVQVLEVFRDITEDLADRVESRTRSLKKDLARMVQEDKLLALGKLVASVAHEINNPLSSIINFSRLLLKCAQDGPPDVKELKDWAHWLELTVAEAERSRDIVKNLLSFARQRPIEPQHVDLVDLVRQIVQLTGHRMEMGKVVLNLALPRKALTFWGDPTQIQQCVANLIFNSLEAMPEGGELNICCDGDGDEVWVEVADTGKGIAEEVMPRIFEPFFSTKSAVQGVGLGLSMVYGIIREHRGRIQVDSPPDAGAMFRLILPAAKPESRLEALP